MQSNALASANYGIQFNLQKFEMAAQRISQLGAGVREIVEIQQARQGIVVNATVIRTASDLSDSLIDVLA